MTQAMLGPDPGFQRLNDRLTSERGLLLALAMFGDVRPDRSIRLAIRSATLILLAVLTASMSFLLGFLRLTRRAV